MQEEDAASACLPCSCMGLHTEQCQLSPASNISLFEIPCNANNKPDLLIIESLFINNIKQTLNRNCSFIPLSIVGQLLFLLRTIIIHLLFYCFFYNLCFILRCDILLADDGHCLKRFLYCYLTLVSKIFYATFLVLGSSWSYFNLLYCSMEFISGQNCWISHTNYVPIGQ